MTGRILLVGGQQPLWNEFRDGSDRSFDCAFANTGAEALATLASEDFTAVVADIQLRDMSGLDFLDAVMRRHPNLVRVVVSDVADTARTVRCIGTGHHHLLKPCDYGMVLSVVERATAMEVWLPSAAAQDLIGRMRWVPSPPGLYFQVLSEMQSPSGSVETIGNLIAQDPAITAKVLQLANSAVFGLQLQVVQPVEAVSYLGFDTTKALVLLAHTFASFERPEFSGSGLDRLWNHAVMTGRFARRIAQAEKCASEELEQASAAGLLHDIGKLLLAANLPERFGQALKAAREEERELWDVENQSFGVSHAELGAFLLGIWGLPQPIVEAVAWHHQLPAGPGQKFGPVAAVHVANVFAHEVCPQPVSGKGAELDLGYLRAIGSDLRLDDWRDLCLQRETAPLR